MIDSAEKCAPERLRAKVDDFHIAGFFLAGISPLVIEMQPHMTMPIHRAYCDTIGRPLDQKT